MAQLSKRMESVGEIRLTLTLNTKEQKGRPRVTQKTVKIEKQF